MLDDELEHCLNESINNARIKRHAKVTLEHLLLSLLDNEIIEDATLEQFQLTGELKNGD